MAYPQSTASIPNPTLFEGDVRLFIEFYPSMLILSLKGRAMTPGNLLTTCAASQLAGFTLSDLEEYVSVGRRYTLQLEPSEEFSKTGGASLAEAILTEVVDLGYFIECRFQLLS